MVEWLKRLVNEGNVIRDRSYTNWNTLDVAAIVAEKERESKTRTAVPAAAPAPKTSKK